MFQPDTFPNRQQALPIARDNPQIWINDVQDSRPSARPAMRVVNVNRFAIFPQVVNLAELIKSAMFKALN